MKNLKFFLPILFALVSISLSAQRDYWQQRAEYNMEIDMDVKIHQYTGSQSLKYYNNSADTLDRVFYHLYFNAFQPGSMMDVRNQQLPDSDPRVKGRISELAPEEIGYMHATSLKMNGKTVKYEEAGTILEVWLDEPILPGKSATFDMEFKGQVPVQIRRSGRDNAEGIAYSMTQWYPKMCEYDYMGWHANPYIGREFYGIFGTFDIKISIDKTYLIGGTGVVQNPKHVGHGYNDPSVTIDRVADKLTWHFKADNVADFAWAADPDYTHTSLKREDGVVLHFLYQKNEKTEENWGKLPKIMDKAFDYIEANYGQYPYEQYTFIQGGDGGMEYPMATLITGERNLGSLVGVSVHELFHSWYQGVLGTNESLYAWMDEGFTSYGSSWTMNYLKEQQLIPGDPVEDPVLETVDGMVRFNSSGRAEPLSIHSDHFKTNAGYGVGAYVKGSAFLHQVRYIVGDEAFNRGMIRYYNTWKFKHPTPNDFLRVMEKESNLELDWFKEYFVYTTNMPDYSIKEVKAEGKKSVNIELEKVGNFPMPIDVTVTFKDGSKEVYYIPLRIMRGEKPNMNTKDTRVVVLEDWPWVNPTYSFNISTKPKKVTSIQIDASGMMADADKGNNTFDGKIGKPKKKKKKSKK